MWEVLDQISYTKSSIFINFKSMSGGSFNSGKLRSRREDMYNIKGLSNKGHRRKGQVISV